MLNKIPMSFKNIVCLFCLFLIWGCKEDGQTEFNIPTYIEKYGEYESNITVNSTLESPLQVLVLNADHVPVADVKVVFSVEEGNAILSDSISITNEEGIASTFITFSTTTENIIISANGYGLEGSPVNYYFSASPSEIYSIEKVESDSIEGQCNTEFSKPLTIKIRDEFNNCISGVEVSFRIVKGGGDISDEKIITDKNGEASVKYYSGCEDPVNKIEAYINDNLKTTFTTYVLIPSSMDSIENHNNYFRLTWTKNINPNFQGYNLYRSDGGSYQLIKMITSEDSLSYEDYNITYGHIYSYKVGTRGMNLNLAMSNILSIEYGFQIDFPSSIGDICLDKNRAVIYVSVPFENKIYIIDATTQKLIDSMYYSNEYPNHLELSYDGQVLYTFSIDKILEINLNDFQIQRSVTVLPELGTNNLKDFYLSTVGKLYLAAYEGNTIVVDPENFYNRPIVIDGLPNYYGSIGFTGDDGKYLYAHLKYITPPSLYKIDIENDYSVLIKNSHGTISGVEGSFLSDDGSKIYLSSGQIISTEDFLQVGEFGMHSFKILSHHQENLYALNVSRIEIYNINNGVQIKTIPMDFNSVTHFEVYSEISLAIITSKIGTYGNSRRLNFISL